MPRTMWKGAISFGLVTIPVAVYPATEEKTLRFNQLHDEDGGRIRMQADVRRRTAKRSPYDEIVKGYEYEKDRYVVLTDEDFDKVPVESSRAIDIVQFVDLDEIDPMLYKKSYYLVPDETGAKAYALLREAMSQDNKVGIAKVSFRDKEHLAALRFKDDAFVLETMYWPDEIREADFGGVDVDLKVRGQELEMARQLIENLTAEWDPEEFTDEYREALLRIVEAKITGEEIEVVEAEPTAKVVDLMEALKASVAAAKKQADERPTRLPRASGRPRRRPPRRRRRPRSPPRRRRRRARRPSASDPAAGLPLPGGLAREDLDALVELFQAADLADVGFDDPARDEIYETWAAAVVRPRDRTRSSSRHPTGRSPPTRRPSRRTPRSTCSRSRRSIPITAAEASGRSWLRPSRPRAAGLIPAGVTAPLRNGFPSTDDRAIALFGARGYTHVRSFWHMERPLEDLVTPAPDPDGITIRPGAVGEDERISWALLEEAFSEHFGYEPLTFDEWLAMWSGFPGYDPTWVFLAFQADEPVGISIVLPSEDGVAWVAELGVLKPWRRHGTGMALLQRSFAFIASEGFASLDWGSTPQNATGATHLYERAGMTVRREYRVVERSVEGTAASG